MRLPCDPPDDSSGVTWFLREVRTEDLTRRHGADWATVFTALYGGK